MDIREEVPIESFSIAAYICRIENDSGRFLIIKRQTSYLSNSWQMVSGKIEKGEKAWEAALREIREETEDQCQACVIDFLPNSALQTRDEAARP